ncbi:MAG: hydrogenase maturation protease [Bacteroidota bacterium]
MPAYCTSRVLVLGCGNRLFGDDGFGPAVIEYLTAHYEIPDGVYVMDVGTGVRKLLFTLSVSPELPDTIFVLDAVDKGKAPGEIFEIVLDDIPSEKSEDFSLHLSPSSNLAKELEQRGVRVRVLACQVESVPPSVEVGLSEAVGQAVQRVCEVVARELGLKEPLTLTPGPSPDSGEGRS